MPASSLSDRARGWWPAIWTAARHLLVLLVQVNPAGRPHSLDCRACRPKQKQPVPGPFLLRPPCCHGLVMAQPRTPRLPRLAPLTSSRARCLYPAASSLAILPGALFWKFCVRQPLTWRPLLPMPPKGLRNGQQGGPGVFVAPDGDLLRPPRD